MRSYRLILQIVFLLIANNMLAEGSERALVVLMKSGTQIILPISERPKITFDGTIMCVGNSDYQIENVQKWMIGDPEEITNIIKEVDNSIVYKNGILTIGNHTEVHAYNSIGVEMPLRVEDGQLDINAWPNDIYVIKAGKETLKIRKR